MSHAIFLADDHPVVRRGLRAVLSEEPGFSVVGEAEDGLQAVRAVERLRPDALILDLGMPGLHGIDVIPILRQRCPHTRIIVFSACTDREVVIEALQGGALAYLHKAARPADVVKAVRCAIRGKRFVGPPFCEQDLDKELAGPAHGPSAGHALLTPREREVLHLAAEGHTSGEIAARLHISPRTVEMHRANMMHKLGLRTQTDLIRYALRRGIISLEECAGTSEGNKIP
jgi:DNA-binding NarL/FixJ family response regulator